MTKKEINRAVRNALKSGNWMLRKSDNGKSSEGLQWNDIGKWTEAPDWSKNSDGRGGLYGNHYSLEGFGYWPFCKDLDFCETDGKHVIVDDDKIKCQKARVLLRNELPEIEIWNGDLYLNGGTFSQKMIFPREFYGDLYLRHSSFLKDITLPRKIDGNLDIRNCKYSKRIFFPQVINGNLYLFANIFKKSATLSPKITGVLTLHNSASEGELLTLLEVRNQSI